MLILNKHNVCRFVLIVLIIATVSFIWSNSLDDATESKEMSSTVVEKVKPIVDPYDKIDDDLFVTIVRKTAHFSEFALLGAEMFLLACTFSDKKKLTLPILLIPVSVCFLCAVTDELLQLTSEGRSCEIRDMLIDLGGIIAGTLFICVIQAFIKWIKSKKSKSII